LYLILNHFFYSSKRF